MKIGKYEFNKVCNILPNRDELGNIRTYMPQDRYNNINKLALNRYGLGPFLKFKICNNYNKPGVYALTIGNMIKYIGETVNLSNRFNNGYGNISPRNCYKNGQETNCRLNSIIFEQINNGKDVMLWFCQTINYKQIEADLRLSLKPEWNKI